MKISKTQRLIDEIMDNFDFSKVAKTMQLLKWEIYMGGDYENREIPDESYLRSDARKMIYDLIDRMDGYEGESFTSHCGPFKVRITKENSEIDSIILDFVVTEWEAYIDEE